jgi:hypothetical protein
MELRDVARFHARLIMRTAGPAAQSALSKDKLPEVDMRKLILTAGLVVAGLPLLAASEAGADPYKWCALYNAGRGGGAQNCYFVTWEQCQAAVSGVGGFCTENQFYDGRPVRTPEERAPVRRKRVG